MTFEEFNQFQGQLLQEVVGMGKTKGKEYANGEERFGNFKRLAPRLDTSPQTIAWIYLVKHLDAIEHYIKTGGKEITSEPIRGRIVDAIVYLTLIAGMIEEKTHDRNEIECSPWEDSV